MKNITDALKLPPNKFMALSMPTTGIRFDAATLALIDTDKDGRIRYDEMITAIKNYPENPHLQELVENFVTMERLYAKNSWAIFQQGTHFIDGRAIRLTFDVADVEAHSALVGNSNCCVIYSSLKRPGDNTARNICSVITKGTIGTLYVGRNGIFIDRDGKDWETTIVKVVENQVSLVEAFWAPWKKIGTAIHDGVQKFLGDKQSKMASEVTATKENNGAALASSIAAVGIGIGFVGTAFASIAAVFSKMPPWKIAAAVVIIVLIVSVPSMIACWWKLRKRDLGAILNASGWAINRRMRVTSRL